MTDEKKEQETPTGATETGAAPEASSEITKPRSKYERIMMAAAEATRLNEEMRRKGTKLERKVTLEALKRVDEGKVKSVVGGRDLEAEPRPAPRPETTAESLFLPPPLLADTDLGDEETEEPTNKD